MVYCLAPPMFLGVYNGSNAKPIIIIVALAHVSGA